ncbi:MAG TPA: acyl-ACP desaturase [Candidatus Binataceae bacterium]|nr:acyl-ACP desaturase [Candidatus Binataceae bacterium]
MPVYRDEVYRIYLDFLEVAEKKRRWSVFDDIPWNQLDQARIPAEIGNRLEIFCAEEMYVPDYSSNGLELCRSMFGMAWFQATWACEESKHALALREYLTRSRLRSEAEFSALEDKVFAGHWQLPFSRARQMACYGALQEAATFLAYKTQRELARQSCDPVLEAIFFNLGRDEAAHAGFYRAVLDLELALDRPGTVSDLAYVLANFKMPGDGLIEDYRERLTSTGAGISPRLFLQHVLWPLLAGARIGRDEIKTALKQQAIEPAAPVRVLAAL